MRRRPGWLPATALAVAMVVGACGPTTPSGPAASAGPTPVALVTDPPVSPIPGPPAATLAAEGGDPVLGQVGTFIWRGGGSDAPWLPGSPIRAGAGEPLFVGLDPAVPIDDWNARFLPAGAPGPDGAIPIGEAGGVPGFAAPGPGRWTVQMSIEFGDDLGSASYFWQVQVE